MDQVTIGARLRTLRRWRGMTQSQLAGLAGVSTSFVSMVEHGQRLLDRRSHISALASALRVSETDLVGGPHLSADRLQSDPHATIPGLRVALQTNTLTHPVLENARPLPDLARMMTDELEPMRRACDYVSLGALLPALIDEVHVHVAAPPDEAASRLAARTLVEACVAAAFTAKNLGYLDLAHLAAVRAEEAADVVDDPVLQGKAAFLRVHSSPWAGSGDRVLVAAERAVDRLEPAAGSTDGRQVLGMLALSASLAAAVARRNDSASRWLEAADDVARSVPDDPDQAWQSFSATNVSVWRVTVGVECGLSGGKVLDQARQVNVAKLAGHSSRRASFLVDVGRGLAREPRTRAEAVRWLRQAETVAPQRIRNSASARETVAYLLGRATATAGGRELRGMAARMGLPH